jgi:ABC transport system ATP-binding/permease protein
LALLIGFVLKFNDSDKYDFASAFHIPNYLFVALIVAMFLSLANSADDIIRDRIVLQRERNLNVRLGYYVAAKALTLTLFGCLQCLLFLLIGNSILEIRGMFWWHFIWMTTTSVWGIAMGLVVSSFVNDAKTAANFVPLILIPQMILGGALIKYEEMNKNLDFAYTINRWFSEHDKSGSAQEQSKLKVPFICQFMPLRWSYEAIVVAQAKLNPFTRRQEQFTARIEPILLKPKASRTPLELARLHQLKQGLSKLSSISGRSPAAIDAQLAEMDRILAGNEVKIAPVERRNKSVTVDQVYVNQKILDLVSKAEIEQADYRRSNESGNHLLINVFFGTRQLYFGQEFSVFFFNACILHGTSLILLGILYLSLRSQLRIRRS